MEKVLIVRNCVETINENFYNIQELGIALSFQKFGYDVDILLHGKNSFEKIVFDNGNNRIKFIYKNDISFLNSPIYFEYLKKAKEYKLIITSEVGKLFNYLLTFFKFNKWVIYHGPYRNSRWFVQLFVDIFLARRISKKVDCIFTKSKISTDFLTNKGYSRIRTVGVALNEENFNNNSDFTDEKLLSIKKYKKIILYIGRFDKDKNVTFIPDILKELDDSFKLVFIGGKNDNNEFKKEFFRKINEYKLDIYYIDSVEQRKLKFYYENSDLFILPSSYEIFGMVLLEAMYFGSPIISSYNGGSSFLINEDKDNINGIIIRDFDNKLWAKTINDLVSNRELLEKIKKNSQKTISDYGNWDRIAKEFLNICN